MVHHPTASFSFLPILNAGLLVRAQPGSVQADIANAALIFVILHILVYPASNGYNSYMDRDEGSIGGLKNPLITRPAAFYGESGHG